MIYLKSLQLASNKQEASVLENLYVPAYHQTVYPFGIFPPKMLRDVCFEHVTIFAGTNGSGKSTLLNIIANLLELPRNTAYNESPYLPMYQNLCSLDYSLEQSYSISKIITSDDVFKTMINERQTNNAIHRHQVLSETEARNKRCEDMPRHVDCTNQKSIDYFLEWADCNKQGGIKRHVLSQVGKDRVLHSNGENAIDYFVNAIEPSGLYLLDEPENSLSPEKQLLLKSFLEGMVRFEKCQFIIATHSPFIMAMNYSKLYDLDDVPAKTKKWYELEHVKQYYNFFEENKRFFQ